jgi:hypothetical protein
MSVPLKKSTICIAEDRAICEPCVKLLLLSLRKYYPGTTVSLFYPPASQQFLKWTERCPDVRVQSITLQNGCGWNIKPLAVMNLFDQGFDEVTFIDSDVLVTQDLRPVFSDLVASTVIVTEHTMAAERDDHDSKRTRLWGLPVGRSFPFGLSSGIVRVTKQNYRLMQRWWELLQSSEYQQAQKIPWKHRPVHMLGDQDVLTALLGSKEFADLPLKILMRGKDIIQFDGVYGYSTAERTTNLLHDGPYFVHSGAGKPWAENWDLHSDHVLREYIKTVYLDLSPYTVSAIQFKAELESDTKWMEPHFGLSRFFRILGLNLTPLVGFPMALCADLARGAKMILRSRSN